METRVAVIGIIVENTESAEKINSILHEYAQYILGRMGVPYQKRKISVISIIMDAPQPVISALSGKLGKLEGVSTKALYSNVMENLAITAAMTVITAVSAAAIPVRKDTVWKRKTYLPAVRKAMDWAFAPLSCSPERTGIIRMRNSLKS